MPDRKTYAGLSLADALRYVAEHHHDQRTRHITEDEYELLLRAADVNEQGHAALQAFP